MEINNSIKPNHYKLNIKGIPCEVKDVIIAAIGEEGYKHFCIGNAIKYVLRAEKKNGIEDYKKDIKYLEEIIDLREKKEEEIKEEGEIKERVTENIKELNAELKACNLVSKIEKAIGVGDPRILEDVERELQQIILKGDK